MQEWRALGTPSRLSGQLQKHGTTEHEAVARTQGKSHTLLQLEIFEPKASPTPQALHTPHERPLARCSLLALL